MEQHNVGDLGLLVVDAVGEPVFSSGAAKLPGLRLQLLRATLATDAEYGVAVGAAGGVNYMAAWHRGPAQTVFVLQPAGEAPTLLRFLTGIDFAGPALETLLAGLTSALLVTDANAVVRYAAPPSGPPWFEGTASPVGKTVPGELSQLGIREMLAEGGKGRVETIELHGRALTVACWPVPGPDGTQGVVCAIPGENLPRHGAALASHPPASPAVHAAPRARSGQPELDHMVGSSDAIRQLKSDIGKIASQNVPVLIVGESGTGKELVAQAIHALSRRANNRLVFVNAAALPAGLVESELFGYEAGAFTGAERAGRKGKFELADHGSLFFDEVGDMPLEIQVKLLRVMQDGGYERVGGTRLLHSDFRLISATNRNFKELIAQGKFRLDLYYRISGVTIRTPSLRERLDDLPLLVRRFLDDFAEKHHLPNKGIGKGVIELLAERPWPGNVRQLLHEVEKAMIFSDAPEISVDDFRRIGSTLDEFDDEMPSPSPPSGSLRDAVAELEKSMIHDALRRHRGNKKKVAEELGISRAYLYKVLGGTQPDK